MEQAIALLAAGILMFSHFAPAGSYRIEQSSDSLERSLVNSEGPEDES